jgi:hypothetical protein
MRPSNAFRAACLCTLLLAFARSSFAQGPIYTGPAPARAAGSVLAVPLPSPDTTCVAEMVDSAAPSNLHVTYVGRSQIDLAWTAPASIPNGCKLDRYLISCMYVDHNEATKTDTKVPCNPVLPEHSDVTSYRNDGLESKVYYNYQVQAVYLDSSQAVHLSTLSPSSDNAIFAETVGLGCLFAPTRSSCMSFGSGTNANINSFYQTNGSYTFLGQVKSIYNGASGSATISADLGTLNFGDGMQVTLTTNPQAGSSGVATVNTGAVPTLSSNGAGQAAQNMLFGGTLLVSESYPVVAIGAGKLGNAGAFGFSANLVAKEGVDVQNFKAGTNINVSSPPFHGSTQLQGYVLYNAINAAPNNSQTFAGALYAGGSYGYSYTSPAYLRDYGFAGKQNNGMGQIYFGIVLNNVATISVQRGFGPSQTYIDSTTMVSTRVNKFAAWSFGVTYQSAPAK